MNIMGVDQSLTGTGVTVFTDNEEYYYLLKSEKTAKTKNPTVDYTRRLIKITNEVEELIKKHKINYACIEGMSYGSKSSIVFDLGGLSHLVRAMFLNNGVKFIVIPPKTLKKFATENGNADKIAMIEEAMKRGANIPFFKRIKKQTVFDDNVVDAYFLAVFCQDYLSGNTNEFNTKIETSWQL